MDLENFNIISLLGNILGGQGGQDVQMVQCIHKMGDVCAIFDTNRPGLPSLGIKILNGSRDRSKYG